MVTDARPFPFLRALNRATPHWIHGEVFYRLQVSLHRSQGTIEAAPLLELSRFPLSIRFSSKVRQVIGNARPDDPSTHNHHIG